MFAPAAACASTAARRASSSWAKPAWPRARVTRTSATTSTATRTACGSRRAGGQAAVTEGERVRRQWSPLARPAHGRAGREGTRLAGVVVDLPPRFHLPQGLHRQPEEPVLRDHE